MPGSEVEVEVEGQAIYLEQPLEVAQPHIVQNVCFEMSIRLSPPEFTKEKSYECYKCYKQELLFSVEINYGHSQTETQYCCSSFVTFLFVKKYLMK